MSMEHWWNDTVRRKPKCSQKNLSQWPWNPWEIHIDWL